MFIIKCQQNIITAAYVDVRMQPNIFSCACFGGCEACGVVSLSVLSHFIIWDNFVILLQD